MEDGPVLLHLLKLRPATSRETLADVLETLWKNRRTGLDSLEKSRVRSLLVLPAAQDLDPVSRLCPTSIGSFLPQKIGSSSDTFPTPSAVDDDFYTRSPASSLLQPLFSLPRAPIPLCIVSTPPKKGPQHCGPE
ncbi:hypothetical protein BHM03_00058270, partial [Ensete ventricosum]